MTRQTTQEQTMTDNTLAAVADADREYRRLAARSGADWARDGYTLAAAQTAVEAARAGYQAAFQAHVAAMQAAAKPTIARVLPVIARTTRTLEVGDVVAEGWGTLDLVAREVVAVERWSYNGYVNVIVTWADGERCTYYDGTRWTQVETA